MSKIKSSLDKKNYRVNLWTMLFTGGGVIAAFVLFRLTIVQVDESRESNRITREALRHQIEKDSIQARTDSIAAKLAQDNFVIQNRAYMYCGLQSMGLTNNEVAPQPVNFAIVNTGETAARDFRGTGKMMISTVRLDSLPVPIPEGYGTTLVPMQSQTLPVADTFYLDQTRISQINRGKLFIYVGAACVYKDFTDTPHKCTFFFEYDTKGNYFKPIGNNNDCN